MDDCNGGGCNIACNGFQRAPLGQRHSPAYGEPLDKEALSYGTALRRSLTPVSKGGLVRDGEARLVAKATRPFRCLGANAAFFELTGYAQAEVDAASIRLLQQPESTSAWDSAIQAAKGGGKHDLQTICQLAHGKQAMLRVQVSMLPLTADEAERHKLADTSEQLLLFVVWLAPVLRMAQDAVHNSSPGARVIVKNRAPFHIENVNADWTSMFGMPEASVVGRSLQVVQGPFTDSRALRQLMDLAARGVEGKATFIAYNIDGKKFLTNHTTWPLVSTAGTIESFVAEVQAVEVVDLQEALKVQIGFVAVVAMPGTKNEASEHRIAHATGELCSFVGSEGGEVVGHAVSKMIGLANTEALVKSMAQLMRGDFRGRPSLVVSLYCADDKVVPVRAEMLPVVDSHGRLSNVMLTFHPCQVDTLADALVRQRTSGVAEFISTAKSPFMMKQASDAWCRIYALTPNEVNGRSLQIIHGPSTDQSLLHKVIGDALAGQPITERITCYQKDGSEVTASITIFPIMSEHGAIDHVRAVVDDVQFASAQARDAWIKSNCQQHVCATNEGTGEDAVMMESAGEDAVAMNGCKDSIDCAMGGASCLESREDGKIEYPMTPEGHIVHINGYTQLVLYPKADPTLEHCLVYMEHLRDANIVKSWQWEGDALRVDMDTQQVLDSTQNSAWCRMWTADLRTWHAWWNRMLWVVSEETRQLGDPATAARVAATARLHASAHKQAANGDRFALQHSFYSSLVQIEASFPVADGANSMCVVDVEGLVQYATKDFLRNAKLEEKEVLGRNLFTLCALPGDGTTQLKRFKDLMQEDHCSQARESWRAEMFKGDGKPFWASLVGEVVFVAFVDKCTRKRVESKCFCISVEDCSEIVAMCDSHDQQDISEEMDPYIACMAQELAFAQEHALDAWKDALSTLSLAEEPMRVEEPMNSKSDKRYQKMLVHIPLETRLQYVEALWRLKAQGTIKEWVWEEDSLSLMVDVDEVTARLGITSGSMELKHVVQLLKMQEVCSHSNGTMPWPMEQEDHEHLNHHDRCASKLSEPGTDFGFLVEDDSVSAMRSRSSSGHAHGSESSHAKQGWQPSHHQQQRHLHHHPYHHQHKEQQQQRARVPIPDDVDAVSLRMQVLRLEKLFSAEQAARCYFQTQAFAAAAELQSMYSTLEVERSVSISTLQAFEVSLSAKTKEIQSLRAMEAKMKAKMEKEMQEGKMDKGMQEPKMDEEIQEVRDILEALRLQPGAEARAFESYAGSGDIPGRDAQAEANDYNNFQRDKLHVPLMASEIVEQFQMHFETEEVRTGFALCDDSGVILWNNHVLSEALGYKEQEMRWCRWQSVLCGPDSDEAEIAHVQSCLKHSQPLSSCLHLYRGDGRKVWMQVRMEMVALDQNVKVSLLCMEDVSLMMEHVLKNNNGIRDESVKSAANKVSQVLEAAIIHGLDCIELITVGFPLMDRLNGGALSCDQYFPFTSEGHGLAGTWTQSNAAVHVASAAAAASPPVLNGKRASANKTEAEPQAASRAGAGRGREADSWSVVCAGEAPYSVLEVSDECACALFDLTGYQRHDVLGRSLSMFVGAVDWPLLVAAMKRLALAEAGQCVEGDAKCKQYKIESLEARCMRKDGAGFSLQLYLHRMPTRKDMAMAEPQPSSSSCTSSTSCAGMAADDEPSADAQRCAGSVVKAVFQRTISHNSQSL